MRGSQFCYRKIFALRARVLRTKLEEVLVYKFLRKENIVNIPEALRRSALKNKNRTALIYFDKKFSYQEIYQNSVTTAAILKDFSVKNHDRTAIWMINTPQFVFAYYGTLINGSIAVPINFMSIANELKKKKIKEIQITEEIKAQILDSKPKMIIMNDFFWPIFNQMKNEINWQLEIILTSPADFLPFPLKYLYLLKAWKEGKYVGKIKNTYRLLELIFEQEQKFDYESSLFLGQPAEEDDFYGFKVHPEYIAQLQYTGGTTGQPKSAILTHKNLVTNVWQCREHLGDFLKDGEVVLGALPFFHIYGLNVCLNTTLLSLGGTLVLVPVFHPKKTFHLIEKHKVTLWPGVNRMYQASCETPEIEKYDLSSLKLCISGAGPIDSQICQKFKELTGCKIVEGYGLSETSPVISVALPEEKERQSIGRPLPETKIKIVNESGQEVSIGQEGEIVVYGPQVMRGYWQKSEETKRALTNGWLRTGDIGKLDKDGFLYFLDREKDMGTVHGENVYPSKIEKVILEHPDVNEVAVVFIPDPKSGETPIAILVPLNGKSKEELEKELKESLVKNLPRIYLPSKFIFVESLDPWKTPIGKILKRKLRQWVIEKNI